jgi:hypothetical protein
MKKYILILLTLIALSINAQAVFAPTKEQLANVAKIKELQKTNKGGKNSKAIIELLNRNKAIIDSIGKSKIEIKTIKK